MADTFNCSVNENVMLTADMLAEDRHIVSKLLSVRNPTGWALDENLNLRHHEIKQSHVVLFCWFASHLSALNLPFCD